MASVIPDRRLHVIETAEQYPANAFAFAGAALDEFVQCFLQQFNGLLVQAVHVDFGTFQDAGPLQYVDHAQRIRADVLMADLFRQGGEVEYGAGVDVLAGVACFPAETQVAVDLAPAQSLVHGSAHRRLQRPQFLWQTRR